MTHYYILTDDKKVIPAATREEGLKFLEKPGARRVAATKKDGVRISTVFLGLDHGYDGVPVTFETMIFGGEHDGYCNRCATWDAALASHTKACEMIFGLGIESWKNSEL